VSTFFGDLWKLSGFRNSFAALQTLTPEGVSILMQAVEGSGNLDDLAADRSSSELDQLRIALPVLRTLRGIRDADGLGALLDDIEANAGPASEPAKKAIEAILAETPAEARQRRINYVQRSALPVLTRLSVDVDLRAASSGANSDEDFGLVPVLVVRLEFDENVAGSDAIVFQVTEEDAAELVKTIARTTKLRKEILSRVPDDLLLSNLPPEEPKQ